MITWSDISDIFLLFWSKLAHVYLPNQLKSNLFEDDTSFDQITSDAKFELSTPIWILNCNFLFLNETIKIIWLWQLSIGSVSAKQRLQRT